MASSWIDMVTVFCFMHVVSLPNYLYLYPVPFLFQFQRIKSPTVLISKEISPKNSKKDIKVKPTQSILETRRMTTPEDSFRMYHPSNLSRPHSFHVTSLAEFDQTMQKGTKTLAISPRVLRRWVARKSGTNKSVAHVYFPTSCGESNPMRWVHCGVSVANN